MCSCLKIMIFCEKLNYAEIALAICRKENLKTGFFLSSFCFILSNLAQLSRVNLFRLIEDIPVPVSL